MGSRLRVPGMTIKAKFKPPSPGSDGLRATNESLKVLRQLCKHFDNERMHPPRPSSAFNSISLLSQSSSQSCLCLELYTTAQQMEIEFL